MTQERSQATCSCCLRPCAWYISRSRIFGLTRLSSCCRASVRMGEMAISAERWENELRFTVGLAKRINHLEGWLLNQGWMQNEGGNWFNAEMEDALESQAGPLTTASPTTASPSDALAPEFMSHAGSTSPPSPTQDETANGLAAQGSECAHEKKGDLIVVDQEGTLTEPLRLIVRCKICCASWSFGRTPVQAVASTPSTSQRQASQPSAPGPATAPSPSWPSSRDEG